MNRKESLTVTIFTDHMIFEKYVEREISGVKLREYFFTPKAIDMLRVKPTLTMKTSDKSRLS